MGKRESVGQTRETAVDATADTLRPTTVPPAHPMSRQQWDELAQRFAPTHCDNLTRSESIAQTTPN